MLILGLGHKAKQGKGEVANFLTRRFGDVHTIVVQSFATDLREELRSEGIRLWRLKSDPSLPFDGRLAMKMVCEYYGVEYDPNAPVDPLNPWGKQRKLQQWYATDYRRAQDPYYWSKRAFSRLDRLKADAVIFDDLRFPDEYDGIHDRGGYCAKISRLGWKSDVPEHISETILDGHPFDAHLGVKNGELPLLFSISASFYSEVANLSSPAAFSRAG
jgi:hypothetical protein